MPELVLLSRVHEHIAAAYALLLAHPEAVLSRKRLHQVRIWVDEERRKLAPKPRKQRPPKWERARLRALAEEARA
jgi:hypothetical protein